MRPAVRLDEVSPRPLRRPPASYVVTQIAERSRPLARTTPVRRAGAGRARAAAGPRSCPRSRSTADRPPRCRACTRGCTAAPCPAAGAYIGVGLPDRRVVLLPPAGVAGNRADVQPERRHHRRSRRRQVRHHQGARTAADALRGAHVRRRGPEERVRAAGPGTGRPAGRARPWPARPAQPPGRRPARRILPADGAALAERLAEIHRRRLVLVCSLAAMRLGRLADANRGTGGVPRDRRSFRPARAAAGRGRGWLAERGSLAGQPHHPPGMGRAPRPHREMARELRVRGDSVDRSCGR